MRRNILLSCTAILVSLAGGTLSSGPARADGIDITPIVNAIMANMQTTQQAIKMASETASGETKREIESEKKIEQAVLDEQARMKREEIDNEARAKRQLNSNTCQAVAPAITAAAAEAAAAGKVAQIAADQKARSEAAKGTATALGPAGAAADLQVKNKAAVAAKAANDGITDTDAGALFDFKRRDITPDGASKPVSLGQIYLDRLVDPFPPPPPADRDKEPADLKAQRDNRLARVNLAYGVGNHMLELQQPVAVPEIRTILDPYNKFAKVVSAATSSGKPVSLGEMLDLAIKNRYSNVEWYAAMQKADTPGLLRELNAQLALQNYIGWRQYQLTMRQAGLEMGQYATNLEHDPNAKVEMQSKQSMNGGGSGTTTK